MGLLDGDTSLIGERILTVGRVGTGRLLRMVSGAKGGRGGDRGGTRGALDSIRVDGF